MKKFLNQLALKFNLNKMPYWMVVLLILSAMLAIYVVYEEYLHMSGAYQECSDCSR